MPITGVSSIIRSVLFFHLLGLGLVLSFFVFMLVFLLLVGRFASVSPCLFPWVLFLHSLRRIFDLFLLSGWHPDKVLLESVLMRDFLLLLLLFDHDLAGLRLIFLLLSGLLLEEARRGDILLHLLLSYLPKGVLDIGVFLLGVDLLPLLLDDLSHFVCRGRWELHEDFRTKFIRELLEDSMEHRMTFPIGRRRALLGGIGRLRTDNRSWCLLYLCLPHPSFLLFGLNISLKPLPFPFLHSVLLGLQRKPREKVGLMGNIECEIAEDPTSTAILDHWFDFLRG